MYVQAAVQFNVNTGGAARRLVTFGMDINDFDGLAAVAGDLPASMADAPRAMAILTPRGVSHGVKDHGWAPSPADAGSYGAGASGRELFWNRLWAPVLGRRAVLTQAQRGIVDHRAVILDMSFFYCEAGELRSMATRCAVLQMALVASFHADQGGKRHSVAVKPCGTRVTMALLAKEAREAGFGNASNEDALSAWFLAKYPEGYFDERSKNGMFTPRPEVRTGSDLDNEVMDWASRWVTACEGTRTMAENKRAFATSWLGQAALPVLAIALPAMGWHPDLVNESMAGYLDE